MFACQILESELLGRIEALAARPLAELLLQQGILRTLAQEILLRELKQSVTFTAKEEPLILSRLWEGVDGPPPTSLAGDWIANLPEPLRLGMGQRWDQVRLQKLIETRYADRLEPYFLERRKDLEQVVYGLIRLRNQGAAEELYLRLLDDGADFTELAKRHSVGEERFTHGLVGPMLITQPHPTIRAVLESLKVGDVHAPFRVEQWVLLVRMEHRQPASLNDATRIQLMQELLQQELDETLDAMLAAFYPTLVPVEGAGGGALPALLEEGLDEENSAECERAASTDDAAEPPATTDAITVADETVSEGTSLSVDPDIVLTDPQADSMPPAEWELPSGNEPAQQTENQLRSEGSVTANSPSGEVDLFEDPFTSNSEESVETGFLEEAEAPTPLLHEDHEAADLQSEIELKSVEIQFQHHNAATDPESQVNGEAMASPEATQVMEVSPTVQSIQAEIELPLPTAVDLPSEAEEHALAEQVAVAEVTNEFGNPSSEADPVVTDAASIMLPLAGEHDPSIPEGQLNGMASEGSEEPINTADLPRKTSPAVAVSLSAEPDLLPTDPATLDEAAQQPDDPLRAGTSAIVERPGDEQAKADAVKDEVPPELKILVPTEIATVAEAVEIQAPQSINNDHVELELPTVLESPSGIGIDSPGESPREPDAQAIPEVHAVTDDLALSEAASVMDALPAATNHLAEIEIHPAAEATLPIEAVSAIDDPIKPISLDIDIAMPDPQNSSIQNLPVADVPTISDSPLSAKDLTPVDAATPTVVASPAEAQVAAASTNQEINGAQNSMQEPLPDADLSGQTDFSNQAGLSIQAEFSGQPDSSKQPLQAEDLQTAEASAGAESPSGEKELFDPNLSLTATLVASEDLAVLKSLDTPAEEPPELDVPLAEPVQPGGAAEEPAAPVQHPSNPSMPMALEDPWATEAPANSEAPIQAG